MLEGISPGGIIWSPEQKNIYFQNLKYSNFDINKSFIITTEEIEESTQTQLKNFDIFLNEIYPNLDARK